MNQIVSLSGGKDSTAMLLLMLERGEPIHSVVWFDTGWEFPQMYDHIRQVEQVTGIEVVRLKPKHPMEHYMFHHVCRNSKTKKVTRTGYGWPSWNRRWCTRIKTQTIDRYCRQFENVIQCIGFAVDEMHRTNSKSQKLKKNVRYPLIETDITEKEALKTCYRHGFDFGGLYKYFDRVSCYLCPLQGVQDLRNVRRYFPTLWTQMLDIQTRTHNAFTYRIKIIPFKNEDGDIELKRMAEDITVHDLDRRFRAEDRQLRLYELERVS